MEPSVISSRNEEGREESRKAESTRTSVFIEKERIARRKGGRKDRVVEGRQLCRGGEGNGPSFFPYSLLSYRRRESTVNGEISGLHPLVV